MAEIIPGNGVCPVCERAIDKGKLMCGGDWHTVTLATRQAVTRVLRDFNRGRASLGELRAVQADAIAEALGRPFT